ncbi:MAG: 23S rRNA (adenine(2503)-C(2))-methyltransferase RlmN, partial [Thermodesulfobacteriota bacterium]|nr:23S rRNA (adenine(2503)-C(2))-methyltransferase RlmN [Thermodesulfobacteriota bacterium]
LLSGQRAKINLIPLNPHRGSSMFPPSMERVVHFQEILLGNHFTTVIRKSKGKDILAACGQLSGALSRGHLATVDLLNQNKNQRPVFS